MHKACHRLEPIRLGSPCFRCFRKGVECSLRYETVASIRSIERFYHVYSQMNPIPPYFRTNDVASTQSSTANPPTVFSTPDIIPSATFGTERVPESRIRYPPEGSTSTTTQHSTNLYPVNTSGSSYSHQGSTTTLSISIPPSTSIESISSIPESGSLNPPSSTLSSGRGRYRATYVPANSQSITLSSSMQSPSITKPTSNVFMGPEPIPITSASETSYSALDSTLSHVQPINTSTMSAAQQILRSGYTILQLSSSRKYGELPTPAALRKALFLTKDCDPSSKHLAISMGTKRTRAQLEKKLKEAVNPIFGIDPKRGMVSEDKVPTEEVRTMLHCVRDLAWEFVKETIYAGRRHAPVVPKLPCFLVSKKGVTEQQPHVDQEEVIKMMKLPELERPRVVFVGIEEKSTLVFWKDSHLLLAEYARRAETDKNKAHAWLTAAFERRELNDPTFKQTLTYNRGDVVVLRGDLIHAGGSSEFFSNIRYQMGLDSVVNGGCLVQDRIFWIYRYANPHPHEQLDEGMSSSRSHRLWMTRLRTTAAPTTTLNIPSRNGAVAYILHLRRRSDRRFNINKLIHNIPLYVPVRIISGVDGKHNGSVDELLLAFDNVAAVFKWPMSIQSFGRLSKRLQTEGYDVDKLKAHYTNQLTPGEMGCSLGHMRMWAEAEEAGVEYALFFEDDATVSTRESRTLIHNFLSILDCLTHNNTVFHMIFLGRVYDPRHSEEVREEKGEQYVLWDNDDDQSNVSIRGYNLVWAEVSSWSGAYILTKEAICRLNRCGFEREIMPINDFLLGTYSTHPRRDVQTCKALQHMRLGGEFKAIALYPGEGSTLLYQADLGSDTCM